MNIMNTVSIASSAMLVDVSISCWSAKRLARKESEELTNAKSAAKNAAKVQKNLLADDKRLDGINKYAADLRNWLARVTLPWSDSGLRLVTTTQFIDFKRELDDRKDEFDRMVADFVAIYPTLISAQAFKLGSMFDRGEYPSDVEVASKFSIRYSFMPVPEAGDFRVDVTHELAEQLRQEYESEYQRRVETVRRETWDRLFKVLEKMSERLGTDETGKNKVFRDTLVENALEVCDMLKLLNVTNDARLESARREVESALLGITADELRKNNDIRADVRAQVDSILDKFSF
jgi:hypothetical protein